MGYHAASRKDAIHYNLCGTVWYAKQCLKKDKKKWMFSLISDMQNNRTKECKVSKGEYLGHSGLYIME